MDWWIDLSKDTKGFKSVLRLGNVVHSDNDEESLYACCCTQKVTVKGCHRYIIFWLSQSTDIFTKFNEVKLQLQGNGVNLIKSKSAISTFLSKFNAVQTKSSPSWTLTVSKSFTLNSFQLLNELIY